MSALLAPAADQRYTVPALARGLQLLRHFTRHERELSGAQLARRTGWPRASVFRMLQTLELAGFIERCGDGPVYRLGLAVLGLGFEYLASLQLTEHGSGLMEALRDSTGESAHLAIRDGREVVFVARAAGSNARFHTIQVGARVPAHATATGRVLLGGLSAQELAELYRGQPLSAYTAATPVSLEALKEAVDTDAQRGFGITHSGFEMGITAIGAPVFNQRGKVCAAIGITVAVASMEPARERALVAQVLETARALTQRMSHVSY